MYNYIIKVLLYTSEVDTFAGAHCARSKILKLKYKSKKMQSEIFSIGWGWLFWPLFGQSQKWGFTYKLFLFISI